MKLFDTVCNHKIPDLLSVVPTIDVVAFPHMIIPLLVIDQRIIQGVHHAMNEGEKMIVLIACKKQEGQMTSISPQDLFSVGTIASIIRTIPLHDGGIKVLIQGIARAEISNIRVDSFLTAQVKPILYDISKEDQGVIRSKTSEIKALVANISQQHGSLASDFHLILSKMTEPDKIADFILSHLTLSVIESQKLLETRTYADFFDSVSGYLVREAEMSHVQERVKNKAKESMNNAQKEFYLREQIKALKQELGEESGEFGSMREKLQALKLPTEGHQEVERVINRLETLSPESAESAVLRAYLENVFDLPWNKETEDTNDLSHAKAVLDNEHFGLMHVKDRILDFLSVRLLSKEKHSIILCFYGPPGTGKTSLAQSIARALGREHFRVSVGGLKDEAEIRGHRRTYVGAIPGRFIKGFRQTQSKNPVIIIDEIDKIGQEVRGDPSAALLEVLDYQQNHSFYDHYLAIPFDISKAIFIATANRLDTIPHALRDRMELIELPAYTFEEKKVIAMKYFVPQALKECGVSEKGISINEIVVDAVITDYTCEAGVRDLERWIKKIGSKIARSFVETGLMAEITVDSLEELLGAKKFSRSDRKEGDKIGVSCGLSWTSYGGEIITIEAVCTPGQGKVLLTGQLGDVMKESAHAALSYIKVHAHELKINPSIFVTHDLHLHVPAGAIPKDGPSAGSSILVALLSACTQQPVLAAYAMTGEIDLQGNILPVGGIKEKILAAKRNGIQHVLLPLQNKHDLHEIKYIINEIDIIFVDHIKDVLSHVFTQPIHIVECEPIIENELAIS